MLTLTRKSHRETRCMNALEQAIKDAIEDEITLETEQDEYRGDFQYVPDETLTLEVDGDALLACYTGEALWFTGYLEECRWEASVKKTVRDGRTMKLTVDVKGIL